MDKKFNSKPKKQISSLVFTAKEPIELLTFLIQSMPTRSRNSVKSILARGQVTVNDHIVTTYNYELYAGQKVSILKNKVAVKESTLIGMTILFEDEHIIVVNKEAGLLSVATTTARGAAGNKELTAHKQLMEYVRLTDRLNRIFIVHRLDKDTSGVMMFAKSEEVKRKLQDSWRDTVKERTYMALVEGALNQPKGYISSWLRETSTHLVYSSPTKNDGQHAITHYKTIQFNERFSLMEVKLETGRKNQIRVHMEVLGHPVVGDKKYGSKTRDIGRLGLHAKVLAFIHPKTEKLMEFEVDAPESFYAKSRPSRGK